MSSKKKPLHTECRSCGGQLLSRDLQAHTDKCSGGPPLSHREYPIVEEGVSMLAAPASLPKLSDHLPPDAVGWMEDYAVLLSPSSMELLQANPRDAALVVLPSGRRFTAVLWPSKEVSLFRVASKQFQPGNESLIELHRIDRPKEAEQLSCRLRGGQNKHKAHRRHIEAFITSYLRGAYVDVSQPLPLTYYGQSLLLEFDLLPLEDSLQSLNIADEERREKNESNQILYIKPNARVKLVSDDCVKETAAPRSMESLAGLTEVKQLLLRNIVEPLKTSNRACSVLLWGLPGSGKSHVLSTLASVLRDKTIFCQSLEEFARDASLVSADTVLLLDWSVLEPTDHRAFAQLNSLFARGSLKAVVLAVRDLEKLEIGLRVKFPIEAELRVPNLAERREILSSLLAEETTNDDEISTIAERTHGYTAGDLKNAVGAAHFADGNCFVERVAAACRRIRPTGIRQFILEVPNVSWNDIGGNEELKLEIQQAVIWPRLHPMSFARFGVDPPSGILLYGPPGCSKTLVARALAKESHMNFLAVKGPELFSKWVGDSEKAIRDLFARARQVAPTIVFFDEIDAVGSARGSDKSSAVGDRVLAQLLTELDGLERQSGVLLLAATNRPDQLDSALLRPGRLDRSIFVDLPSATTRQAILRMRTARMCLSEDVHIEKVVEQTQGYSGAELVAVCRQAGLLAMRENIDALCVAERHFAAALKEVVPRTDAKLLHIYEKFRLGAAT